MEDWEGFEALEGLWEENMRDPGEGLFTDLFTKSTRNCPAESYSSIDVFLDIVSQELRELQPDKTYPCNLSPSEQKALTSLEKNYTIIIKPSDKGGTSL